jgi:serine/threonine-protein kinase haspin
MPAKGYGSKAKGKSNNVNKFYSDIFSWTTPEEQKLGRQSNENQESPIVEKRGLEPKASSTVAVAARAKKELRASRTVGVVVSQPSNTPAVDAEVERRRSPRKKKNTVVSVPKGNESETDADLVAELESLNIHPAAGPKPRQKPKQAKPKSTPGVASTRISHSITEQTRHVSSIFDLIQDPENRCIKSYQDFTNFVSANGTAKKIAEAGFGEVYQISISDPDDPGSPEESVFKILPLRRQAVDARTRSKWTKEQKEMYEREMKEHTTLKDATSEIKILMNLSPIVGFVDFKELHVLRGRSNSYWSSIYQSFQASQSEKSAFPDPMDANGWADDQLFLAIEMVYAGEPLSKLLKQMTTVWSVWDIMWGVLLAIGRAEEHFEFEHRDLHVGNICLKPLDATHTDGVDWPNMQVQDYTRDLNFTDLEVTILDYGLSRIRLPDAKRGQDVIYTKLEEDIFRGDESESRQYAMYRHMKNVMYFDEPNADYEARADEVAKSRRNWRGFHPLTTAVWLCFLVEKLAANIKWPSESAENEQWNMKNVKILAPEERELARAKMLVVEARLKELFEMLTLGNIPSEVWSATSVVEWAEDEDWIIEGVMSGYTSSSADETSIVGHLMNILNMDSE